MRADPGGVLATAELPPVAGARVFEVNRLVRLGDADQHGRLRLDALARHLQDIATDDYSDSGLSDAPVFWVVRRAAFSVTRWPRYLERVSYATFCGGTGPQWAERRTSARGEAGGRLETSVLWASLDAASGRPAPIPARFAELWGVAAVDRRISARLLHPSPPQGAGGRPWELRATDLDVLGHVNNAGHWEAVADELARCLDARIPVTAECEYRLPLDLGDEVRIISEVAGDNLRVWLVSRRGVHASAVVATTPAD
jgi:acyl-ACP thioesterase